MSDEFTEEENQERAGASPILLSKKVDEKRMDAIKNTVLEVQESPHEEAADSQEQVELDWGNKDKPAHKRKYLVLSVAVCGVLIVFFGVCATWALFQTMPTSEEANEGAVVVQRLSFEEERSLRDEIIKNYLEAPTWREKLQYVRDPKRVEPLMERHYAQFSYKPEDLSAAERDDKPLTWNGKVVWHVQYFFTEGRMLNMIIENDASGIPKVDWESEVVFQPSNWNRFIEDRSSKTHEFRVMIQGAQLQGFHGYEFDDYRKYRCFKLMLPKTEEYLWGYTEIDSELDRELYKVITHSGNYSPDSGLSWPVVLRLQFPENAQTDRCVRIVGLTEKGWMIPLSQKD